MVRPPRPSLWQLSIIAFCLWHLTAVTLYVLPKNFGPVWLQTSIGSLSNITSPYVQMTSQWQKWDIFSPNPMRNVHTFIVEVQEKTRWRHYRSITPFSLSWSERGRELKILGRLTENWSGLSSQYLTTTFCQNNPLLRGKRLRLRIETRVIPSALKDLHTVTAINLPRAQNMLGSTVCPSSL